MLRQFTKAVGRYRAGEHHDYPRGVWNKLASDVGEPLDGFSAAVEENKVLQSALKGRPRIHRRLGATQ